MDNENSNIPQRPLTTTQLIKIAQIISENIVTTVSEIGIIMNDDCLHQILKHMPVMYLKHQGVSQVAVRPSYGRPLVNVDGYFLKDGLWTAEEIFSLNNNLKTF